MQYCVIVGNIGTVYEGDSYPEAFRVYLEYTNKLKRGETRAEHHVTLFDEGYIVEECITEEGEEDYV